MRIRMVFKNYNVNNCCVIAIISHYSLIWKLIIHMIEKSQLELKLTHIKLSYAHSLNCIQNIQKRSHFLFNKTNCYDDQYIYVYKLTLFVVLNYFVFAEIFISSYYRKPLMFRRMS